MVRARDCALALKYVNTNKAIIKEVNDKYKRSFDILNKNECQLSHSWHKFDRKNQDHFIHINEPGIFSLIFKSKQEIAEIFQDWVFEEVLPQIRKKGKFEDSERVKKLDEEFKNIEKII